MQQQQQLLLDGLLNHGSGRSNESAAVAALLGIEAPPDPAPIHQQQQHQHHHHHLNALEIKQELAVN